MAYKLVIADTVKVPVKFTLNNAGKPATFSFSLICQRRTQAQIKEAMEGEQTITELLMTVTSGWEGQTVVVDEDGKPADFNPDSLAMLLGIAGASALIGVAYLKECGAKEKN